MLTHGHQVARAAVLWHGLTNCPAQFAQFGQLLHARGYNVLIPRLPLHGLVDQMSGVLKDLTAEQLRAHGDAGVDLARGLGDELTVVGLSGGGVLAAWAAQFRPEVVKAVVIAPSLGIVASPTFGNGPATKVMLRLPNFYAARTEENIRMSSPYVHYQRSSRGSAEFCRLGVAVMKAARRQMPAARSVLVVTNAVDTVVSNGLIQRLVRRWQARAPERVEVYEFPADHYLPHDLIDPLNKLQQTAFVYPLLLDKITR